MFRTFSHAAIPAPSSDVYLGPVPPYEAFRVPDFLQDFCRKITTGKDSGGHDISQILVFGGSVLDPYLGLKPKDYDLYIACPDLARSMIDAANNGGGEDPEIFEELLGYDFPLYLHDESFSFKPRVKFLEPCFGVNGVFQLGQASYRMDIFIGERPISPDVFSRNLPAPILSPVVSLYPESNVFAYQSHFADHADNRLLSLDIPCPRGMLEKAKRKGLDIVQNLPAPHETVSSAMRPSFPEA